MRSARRAGRSAIGARVWKIGEGCAPHDWIGRVDLLDGTPDAPGALRGRLVVVLAD